jgi:hypothetical protein
MSEGPLTRWRDEPGNDSAAQLVKRVAALSPAAVDVERGWPEVLQRARGSSPRAAQLLERVREISPRPVDVASGWDRVIERLARPHGARWASLAAVGAAVLLAWVSLQWRGRGAQTSLPAPSVAARAAKCEGFGCQRGPTGGEVASHQSAGQRGPQTQMCIEDPPSAKQAVAAVPLRAVHAVVAAAPPPSLPEPPLVEAPAQQPPQNVVTSAEAVWSVPVEGSLEVERGRFEVGPHAEPYTVTTPEVSLASSSARYAADVTEAGTTVRVFEGEVEVVTFASKQQVTLRAPEERSFTPGSAPSALDVVPPEVSSPACARRSFEQRVACLSSEAKGEGLKAQAALYEVAYLLARSGRAATAELTLRESLRRFPQGVLNPEVRLALIRALYAERRLGEAGRVAREFLAECPTDPRAAEVERFVKTLEWLESR